MQQPPAGGAPLATKDYINLAGHKVPISLLAVAATILAAFLVLRRGGSVGPSTGTAAAAPLGTGTGVFGGVGGTDTSGALASLSQQIGSLQQDLVNRSLTPAPSTVPPPPPAVTPAPTPTPTPTPTPAGPGWHFGGAAASDNEWRWAPAFAAAHGLSVDPHAGLAPTGGQQPAGVTDFTNAFQLGSAGR